MKHGRQPPQLKSRQDIQQGTSKLDRLNLIGEWSQKPTTAAAAALLRVDQETGEILGGVETPSNIDSPVFMVSNAKPVNPVNTGNIDNTVKPVNTGNTDKKVRPVKKTEQVTLQPWQSAVPVSAAEPVQVTTFKIPVSLYQKLKFVAGSIPGESMTSILLRSMEREVEVLMGKLGYPKE